MTIRHLQIFTEVCKTESITKAGEALGMAQPAVSNAIKELEAFYQVRLFDRMNRRLYLTDAGLFLEEHANAILTQLEEVRDMIGDMEKTARIRIGSNSTFGSCYLPGLLQRFRAHHPTVSIYTRIENSSAMERVLLHNELDFAIVDDLSSSQYFYKQLLFTDKMLLVCSPGFPFLPAITQTPEFLSNRAVTLETISTLPLLLREQGSGSRSLIEKAFRMLGKKPVIVSESSSTQALIQLCLQGQGLMLLTESQADSYVKKQRLIQLPLENFDLCRPYYLVYHKSKYLTSSMRAFLEQIKTLLPDPSCAAPLDNDFS